MAGFTLYETLRIFVPGALAVAITDLALRLAFGPDPFGADPSVAGITSILESAVGFTAVALIAGLLLYLADLPSKLRILREGDPDRGFRLPSLHLQGMLGQDSSVPFFSLWWILSDGYLPPELHRRVYLFGSLFRIFVDLRLLLALGLVGGCAISLATSASAATDFPPLAVSGVIAVAAMTVTTLAVGLVGVRIHAFRVTRKRKKKDENFRYWDELRTEVAVIRRTSLAIAASGAAAALLIAEGLTPIGLPLVLASLFAWYAVEIGPPGGASSGSWRSEGLRRLGGSFEGIQYAPVQRLACDLALFLPWFVAATASSSLQGRTPTGAAWWLIIALPCTAIMSLRKHEERLLFIYEDQSVWLDLHETDIKSIAQSGRLPRLWNQDAVDGD